MTRRKQRKAKKQAQSRESIIKNMIKSDYRLPIGKRRELVEVLCTQKDKENA